MQAHEEEGTEMENQALSTELYWLVLTTLMTAVMWVPYIINRILENGQLAALKLVPLGVKPGADWAVRATAAHNNSVENLVIFATLILVVQISGSNSEFTAMAAMVYFLARAAHYMIYLIGIPVVRTLTFAVSAFAQIGIALRLLGWM